MSQDDVLYPHLTVLESLTYAAMLKLPKSLTREEKMEQVVRDGAGEFSVKTAGEGGE